MPKTLEIAALNDLFRTGIEPALGRWLITQGIQSLPPDDQFAILHKVRSFAAFTEDNDPHGTRDFGAFEQ